MKKPVANLFVVSILVTMVIGTPMWLIWTYASPLFPFLIVWLIVHPLAKIWRRFDKIEEEL